MYMYCILPQSTCKSTTFLIPIPDSSTLQEHQITEGSKLHLSVRKSGHGASSGNPEDFFGLLREVIRGHFSEQDTERVMQKFKEVCYYFVINFFGAKSIGWRTIGVRKLGKELKISGRLNHWLRG